MTNQMEIIQQMHIYQPLANSLIVNSANKFISLFLKVLSNFLEEYLMHLATISILFLVSLMWWSIEPTI
jgi:hypothetical protein